MPNAGINFVLNKVKGIFTLEKSWGAANFWSCDQIFDWLVENLISPQEFCWPNISRTMSNENLIARAKNLLDPTFFRCKYAPNIKTCI